MEKVPLRPKSRSPNRTVFENKKLTNQYPRTAHNVKLTSQRQPPTSSGFQTITRTKHFSTFIQPIYYTSSTLVNSWIEEVGSFLQMTSEIHYCRPGGNSPANRWSCWNIPGFPSCQARVYEDNSKSSPIRNLHIWLWRSGTYEIGGDNFATT